MADKIIANPGSAIGEAVGASMERALAVKLTEIAKKHGCTYVVSGLTKTKSGAPAKKLLMYDNDGNQYDIDGVIANQQEQPLILMESKYIRYKKHNRDKGSWICTAHSAVRRRYQSVRSSIAILAGSWSRSSLAMMKSNDINLFLIPFPLICEILAHQGVNFNWEEKDKDRAMKAWETYAALDEPQKNTIGEQMIASIEEKLASLIGDVLNDSRPRHMDKIAVELVSNFGEIKVFEFDSVENALAFLEKEDLAESFLTATSATLRDKPPKKY